MSTWQSYLDANQARFQSELMDFLRIPSISALPEHRADVRQAGAWVAERLQAAGAEHVEIMETGGHPVVYGDWLHAPGKPTILIYGHFDVQPVDPLHLWSHPPFDPTVIEGKVYARGASDDKGNMLVPILAVEALLRTGGAPVNLKFCFEGQEEIGSPQIPDFLTRYAHKFACDLALSADGGQWSETEPSVLLSLKGVCGVQIDVQGAKTDLHSGSYGGAIQNPIHALVWLLDSLRSPEGKILVEGFYDDVIDLSEQDRADIAAVPFDETEYLENLGLEATFGEPGYTTRERSWGRPTLEINGIWGGFQGEGIKTVLPNTAHAKITCRLVADQHPHRIVAALTTHLQQHAPVGVKVTVTPLAIFGKPYLIEKNHPGNQVARAVHLELYGQEPYYTRAGGSIPICGAFLENLGAYTVNFGFGLRDEGAHAPDEFYRLSSFVKGQTAYCMLLHELAETQL